MLTSAELRVVHFAPVEPDVIVSEIWVREERIVAELIWGFDGTKKLWLSKGQDAEVDPMNFAELLTQEIAHLDKWAAALRLPGAAWDADNAYHTGRTS